MKYLLDTYAWIEFFKASAKGERVAKLLENKKNKIVVCDVVFAEIFGWAIRKNTYLDVSLLLSSNIRISMNYIRTSGWRVLLGKKECV
jgi:predicted nucleic acid-binding protein